MGRFLIALLVSIVAASASAPARAQRETREYRRTVREALREFDDGRWEEARVLFQRAHEIYPNARTLRGIGMAAFEMRDYVAAYRALVDALSSDERALTRRQAAEVEALLDRTRSFLGRYLITLSPPGTRLEIDLRPAELEPDGSLMVGVGDHTLTASHPGYRTETHRLLVEGQEDREIAITLEPDLPPEPVVVTREVRDDRSSTLPIVLLASSGALAVGVTTGIVWIADRGAEIDRCRNVAPDERCTNLGVLESEQTAAVVFTAVFGVATVAAGGVGAYLLWTAGDDDDDDDDDASARVACAPGLAGVHCAGRF